MIIWLVFMVLLSIILFVILHGKVCMDSYGWMGFVFFLFLFSLGLSFSLLVTSFSITHSVGDSIPLKTVVMRTNYVTCVTYTDFDDELKTMTFKSAKMYNCEEIVVKGQNKENSWGITTKPAYNVWIVGEVEVEE